MDETAAWTQFWTGRAEGSEHRYRDPSLGAVIAAHWQHYFSERFSDGGAIDLIDLACGEGEVLRFAEREAVSSETLKLSAFCADIAPGAVALAARALKTTPVVPTVADGGRLPFAGAVFDCVVSQYGLEYAGPDAFSEAGRVVGKAGGFHALVHCEGGLVEESCSAVAELLGVVLASGLFDALSRYATVIPQAARGEAEGAKAQACVTALREALEGVEAAIGVASPGPARDHVARLVGDCRTLATRLGAYSPDDVVVWIAGQRADIDAFHHRMTSMIRVAQSQDQMRDICERLAAEGLTSAEVHTLAAPAGDKPLAWVVDAQRGAAL